MAVLVVCAMPNHHTKPAPRGPIAAPWRGAHRPPYLFSAAVIVMKVVGIDKIKLFRNFIFSKIDRYFYRLSASSPAIFFDFDMSKKSKIRVTKSALYALCVMFVTSMDGPSGKLTIASLRSKIFAQEVPGVK